MFVLAVASLILFLFFGLMPNLSRFLSMAASSIDFDPTMKFSCSDTHPWPFALRRMSMKLSHCLFAISSFRSR